MAKKRLTQDDRQKLKSLADSLVSAPQHLIDGYEAARSKLLEHLAEEMKALYSPEEMKVLAKHGVVFRRKNFRLRFRENGWQDYIDLSNWESYFQVPAIVDGHFAEKGTTLYRLLKAFAKAQELKVNAAANVLKDYVTLFRESRYFEDVAEVWPEAERLRAEICVSSGKALALVNPELIARIKADIASRAPVEQGGEAC